MGNGRRAPIRVRSKEGTESRCVAGARSWERVQQTSEYNKKEADSQRTDYWLPVGEEMGRDRIRIGD